MYLACIFLDKLRHKNAAFQGSFDDLIVQYGIVSKACAEASPLFYSVHEKHLAKHCLARRAARRLRKCCSVR